MSKVDNNLNYFFNRDGKALILACDQGIEHGPVDFNEKNINPNYILDIATSGSFTGLIFQKGLAEKYYNNYSGKTKVPLLVKLNGKTSLVKGEPYSPQICSIKEAVEYGARGVGYTIYLGSEHEAKIFKEFCEIKREARNYGLPIFVWMYARGKVIKNDLKGDVLAYGARVALELGADVAKMKYNGNVKDLQWMVKSAGKTKIIIAGGSKAAPEKILKEAYDVVHNGAAGMAVGRNIWQSPYPQIMSDALNAIVLKNSSLEAAISYVKQSIDLNKKKI
ncbi:MAG: fructose-bisphosphate aldolase [Nanoarchaeota archaeon]|nr:fructose-bisphosphate aldolase [Nanoarchaeota archaeon]